MNPEQAEKVGCRGLGKFLKANSFQFCYFVRNMAYQCGMIQFAAMRDRRQIGGVGLDEQSVKRDKTGHFLDLQSVFERDDAGYGNVEAKGKGRFGHSKGFGKTVKHASNLAGALLCKDAQGVGSRLAGVNNQGLASFQGGPDMGAKALALPFQITLETVVIEPGFTDRDDFRVVGQANQGIYIRLLAILRIGMNPDRSVQVGEAPGQGEGSRKPLKRNASNQCPAYPVGLHGRHEFLLPTLKVREIEVAVRIDQQGIH